MKNTLIILSAILISLYSNAQDAGVLETDSIIFKAMQDEMERSMEEYEHPEAGKFFYIMYRVEDCQSFLTHASLGSIINSTKSDFREQSYRIMLGDYDFNDENFDSDSRDYDRGAYYRTEVPLGNDYMGLRRALWNNTEMSFKSCVKSYLDKKTFFEEHPHLKPDLPDYTKSDAITNIKHDTYGLLAKEEAEALVKKVSMVFRDYEDITESSVTFSQILINAYLLSTEGTMCKVPLNYSVLSVNAQIINDTVPSLSCKKDLFFYEQNPANFVRRSDQITNSAKNLADYVIAYNDIKELEDDYEGPVIFSRQASAKLFYQTFFRNGSKKLTTYRKSVSESDKYEKPKKDKVFEDKIGEKVAPKDLSVTMFPKMKTYNGEALFGSVEVDVEGIQPQDTIRLIEDGVLKILICDRTPTPKVSSSSGHNRFGVSSRGVISRTLPSNLLVEFDKEGEKKARLTEQLIEICKEEELEFGIEVCELDSMADKSPLVYYKVDLEGNREMLRSLSFPGSRSIKLKKLVSSTEEAYVSNILSSSRTYNVPAEMKGSFIGLIVPSSVLIKDVELFSSGSLDSIINEF